MSEASPVLRKFSSRTGTGAGGISSVSTHGLSGPLARRRTLWNCAAANDGPFTRRAGCGTLDACSLLALPP